MSYSGSALRKGIYAEIHVHDASTAQSIATGVTYTKLTLFTDNGLSSNCTADVANDKIIVTHPGIYQVQCHLSLTAASNNVIFKSAPFVDGVEQDCTHWERKIALGGDVGAMGFSGLISAAVADVPIDVDVRIRHDQGGAEDITVTYANFNIIYIGEI